MLQGRALTCCCVRAHVRAPGCACPLPVQEPCKECGKPTTVKPADRHHLCPTCKHERYYPAAAAAAAPPPAAPSPPPPLFERDASSHSHLSVEQRWAIVILHKEGHDASTVARKIPCDLRSVRHWLSHYEQHHSVEDEPRSGRPRMTDEATDTAIAFVAHVEKFTTPNRLKRKLQLNVSSRTIDRRLQGAGLFGRVARHRKKLTEEDISKRLSFAEGYAHMTKEDWMRVMFADEKIVKGAGFSGQVWVRRPKGEADNPDYSVDKQPHPVKLHVWGCFCGRGLGYLYIFNENMDGKLLKRILGTHLKESAELHFEQDPPEPWWLLQDNDPKHKSVLVQTWLFNNGISLLDFPPYSPDLNPIENLWNDLARRVEERAPETWEELQDVIAEEWAATEPSFLRKLASSMPKRCQAVIEAKGQHTKY
jgi:transposase